MSRHAVVTGIALVAMLGARAQADEIRVLSSLGIKAVVDELAPKFESASGHDVTAVFDLASVLREKIESGEPFDVAILTPPLIDDLIAKGLVAGQSRADVASVGLGIMIRAGGPKPDLASVAAFERALLDADSITYARAGASGAAFVATIERLGLTDALRDKLRPADSGEEVAANVATGRVELGILPVSEILPVAGADLGGAFPADVQTYIGMVAGLAVNSAESVAAKDFVTFLVSPDNTKVIEAKGMQR